MFLTFLTRKELQQQRALSPGKGCAMGYIWVLAYANTLCWIYTSIYWKNVNAIASIHWRCIYDMDWTNYDDDWSITFNLINLLTFKLWWSNKLLTYINKQHSNIRFHFVISKETVDKKAYIDKYRNNQTTA